MWPLWASIRGFTVVMDHVPSSWLSGVAMASARDSAWTVVTNAGKDDQGDEWFAFGSACGVVGIAEKGDCTYAGLMFCCGGDNSRIFYCIKEGDDSIEKLQLEFIYKTTGKKQEEREHFDESKPVLQWNPPPPRPLPPRNC